MTPLGSARPHPVLAAAIAAMGQRYVHRFPVHLGGPPPLVRRSDQAAIVPWCAAIVAPYVDEAARAELLAALEELRGDPSPERRGAIAGGLARLGAVADPADPIHLAELVASVERRRGRGDDHRNSPRTARAAAAHAVATLARVAHGGAPVHFLRALDERLVRAEVTGAARRFSRGIDVALDAVAYRGADARGGTAVVVARLHPRPAERDPSWGALVHRTGWHWSEGAIGDALALVPEEHLEAAARAAFALLEAREPARR